MYRMYEYRCKKHGVFESLSTLKDRQTPAMCPVCGSESEFKISTPRPKLEGISGDFPTAADRWAKLHENHGYANRDQRRKRERDNQHS